MSRNVYPTHEGYRAGCRRHRSPQDGDIESTANMIADILDLPEAPPLAHGVLAGHFTITLTNAQARRLAALAQKGTP